MTLQEAVAVRIEAQGAELIIRRFVIAMKLLTWGRMHPPALPTMEAPIISWSLIVYALNSDPLICDLSESLGRFWL